MAGLKLAAALVYVLYGGWECIHRKQPLFFKLLLCATASYLLGTLFTAGYTLVYGHEPEGFHVEMLGYMGTYFFLLFSYYSTMNQLADGGEAKYRGYRLAAASGPLLVLVLLAHSVRTLGGGIRLTYAFPCLPIAPTLYFSIKHLILPDVGLGIIRVIRPYSAYVIIFCMMQVLLQTPACSGLDIRATGSILLSVLLMTLPPVAEMGIRKWFI